jgi:hypothetical protein
MSSAFRLSIILHVTAIAVGAIAATAYPNIYSASPQSLADYVSAICAKSFGSAPAAEASYLAENVSAMTKMMIDMGIRPSGELCLMRNHRRNRIAVLCFPEIISARRDDAAPTEWAGSSNGSVSLDRSTPRRILLQG